MVTAIQPVRIAERQRRQQHALDDAEDGAVGADPERQRGQGHGGEAGRAAQHAQRVPDILAQLGHVLGPCHATLPAYFFASALAAACWNARRTSLASLFGKFERCTIRI